MSKRYRRDELTGRLTESQRRNRRSLDPLTYSDTSLTLSTGGGTGSTCGCPSTCPEEGVNFGPGDAGIEWYSPQSTGTVIGHVYLDVDLEGMGFVPGDDPISYCYTARVGPSTGPIEVYCDGHLGRIEKGLIAQPLLTSIDLWEGSSDGFYSTAPWEGNGTVGRDPSGTWFVKTPSPGVCAGSAAMRWTGLPSGLKKMLVQFSYQRQGTNTADLPISNTPNIGDYHVYYAANDQLVSTHGFVDISAGSGWETGHGSNLFVNTAFTALRGGGTNVNGLGNPVSVYWNGSGSAAPYLAPARAWVTTAYYDSLVIGGLDPLTSISTSTSVATGDAKLVVGTRSAGNTGLYNVPCPDTKPRGWFKYWDISCMRDEHVEWRLGSSGRVAILPGGIYTMKTPYPASTVDEKAYSHSVWREWSNFSTGAPLGGSWGSPYPRTRVQIYPTSTLGTALLDCEPTEIWGGDVWVYSTGVLGVTTGGSTCCHTYVKLNFLDQYGTILSTYGSTGGTNKYADTRVTGVENLTIPVDAVTARFTQIKTGACDCYGVADDLMFSEGPCCIHYSPPIIVAIQSGFQTITSTDGTISVVPPATAITAVYSTGNSTLVSGDDIYDAVTEHSRVNLNVLEDSLDVRSVANATGDASGTAYPDVWLADLGMSTADTISLRWEARVTT